MMQVIRMSLPVGAEPGAGDHHPVQGPDGPAVFDGVHYSGPQRAVVEGEGMGSTHEGIAP